MPLPWVHLSDGLNPFPSLGGVFPLSLFSFLNGCNGKGDGFLVVEKPAASHYLQVGEGDKDLGVILIDVGNDVVIPFLVDFLALADLVDDFLCHVVKELLLFLCCKDTALF